MNFVDAQMGRRMASRTLQEFNENIQVAFASVFQVIPLFFHLAYISCTRYTTLAWKCEDRFCLASHIFAKNVYQVYARHQFMYQSGDPDVNIMCV